MNIAASPSMFRFDLILGFVFCFSIFTHRVLVAADQDCQRSVVTAFEVYFRNLRSQSSQSDLNLNFDSVRERNLRALPYSVGTSIVDDESLRAAAEQGIVVSELRYGFFKRGEEIVLRTNHPLPRWAPRLDAFYASAEDWSREGQYFPKRAQWMRESAELFIESTRYFDEDAKLSLPQKLALRTLQHFRTSILLGNMTMSYKAAHENNIAVKTLDWDRDWTWNLTPSKDWAPTVFHEGFHLYTEAMGLFPSLTDAKEILGENSEAFLAYLYLSELESNRAEVGNERASALTLTRYPQVSAFVKALGQDAELKAWGVYLRAMTKRGL